MQSVKFPSAVSEYSKARILRELNNPCLQYNIIVISNLFLKTSYERCYVMKNIVLLNEILAAWYDFWKE